MPQPISHGTTNFGIALEQAISRQRLRPGSGMLSVEIQTDGPTRVLMIRDMLEKKLYAISDEKDWSSISLKQRPNLLDDFSKRNVEEVKEMQFTMRLAGFGVNLISRRPSEELLYSRFSNIVSEVTLTGSARTFCISVKDVQFDNQVRFNYKTFNILKLINLFLVV